MRLACCSSYFASSLDFDCLCRPKRRRGKPYATRPRVNKMRKMMKILDPLSLSLKAREEEEEGVEVGKQDEVGAGDEQPQSLRKDPQRRLHPRQR